MSVIQMNQMNEYNDPLADAFNTTAIDDGPGETEETTQTSMITTEVKIVEKTCTILHTNVKQLKPKPTDYFQFFEVKEKLYIEAIKNLFKMRDFLLLNIDLLHNIITEEEFESEIKNNSKKYVITTNPIENEIQLLHVIDIIKKVQKELTADEVFELFSLDIDEVELLIEQRGIDFEKISSQRGIY